MMTGSAGPSPAAESARRHSEKAQIQDIKERFSNYIGNVKSMRSQLRQGDGSSASQRRREEIVTIRNMYEQEMGKLREKLEQNYRERSGDYPSGHSGTMLATEYQDRIWEMNRDIVKKDEEIRALQLLVAQQESNIQSLKNAAATPTIQLELAKQDLREVERNIHMAQAKYEEEFSQRVKLQEDLVELRHHTENINQLHMKESQDLREQVVRAEAFVLQLEDKLRTVSRGGPALMEIVQKIQDASEVEVKRLQNETETVYNHSLLELQMRLNNDQMLLGQAQEENQRLHQRVEELTNEVNLLEKKLFSEEISNRTLVEKLEAEHGRGLQHMRAMEARLEGMQDLLLAKMKELNTFQESNVSLRSELDTLRSMLEEEEQQMGTAQLNLPQSRSSSLYLWEDPLQSSMPNLFPDYAGISGALSSTARPEGNDLSEGGEEEDHHGQTEQLKRPASAPALTTHIQNHSEGDFSSGSMTDSADPKSSTTPSSTNSDLRRAPVSSALGDLEITDVDPCGNFVRIINRSPHKEEDIGGFLLQQNIRGHPVSVYRFPPKTRIMASNAVTVWASAAGMPHNPPTDFLWKQQSKFVTEPRCTTILCTPNGQATAWFTPVRNKMKKSSDKNKVFKSEPKIQSPLPLSEPSKVDEEPTNGRKSQSSKSPRDHHLVEKVPRLLNREKTPPAVLPATSSPWTQSTTSPTHPDFSPSQLLPSGYDGISTCRQWRSHTAKAEPPSGVPSPGPKNGRDPSVIQGSKKSRGPTRSAGTNSRGVLYLGYSAPAGSVLHKFFSNSSYNIRLASHVSLVPTVLSDI
ncbi:lamin tail domain-containing protein 1 isoform X2 [Pseudophryne corroboree]|uniref:lamin tail domain-containing protein 1 isoform X2 n=1 Tax=Pseudophryne corroboree TaxID=495146 RepID=UPI003082153B